MADRVQVDIRTTLQPSARDRTGFVFTVCVLHVLSTVILACNVFLLLHPPRFREKGWVKRNGWKDFGGEVDWVSHR